MANLKQWLLTKIGGESIEGVVIGKAPTKVYWNAISGDYDIEDIVTGQPQGKLLTWAEAEPFLDYEFDVGFGPVGCNPVYVWTKTRIIVISEHDGSTIPRAIPRHPIDVVPNFL